jgi:hypothetical protein
MSGFCRNCGTPLTGAFCAKCGQPAQSTTPSGQPSPGQPAPASQAQGPSTAPPPQSQFQAQPAVQPPAAGAPKKSALGKVLLIIGVVVVLLFAMGAAGAWYTMHWVKGKVRTYTGGALGGSPEIVAVAHGNACALLSREDLQQLLGITIEKSQEIMEGSEPGCAYFANSAAFAELQKMAIEQARRDSAKAAQRPAPKTDNPLELLKDTKDMEGIVKGLGLTQPPEDGRVFSFTLQRNFDPSNWSVIRGTMSVVPGFEDVSGVGDHAMIGSFGHALYVLQGNTVIHLETTYVPDARARGADIARKIAAHL